jgi:hypothetical protein
VQGHNSFADLAEALKPFTKELMDAAGQGGLAYAKWQMDRGEAEFMQQYRKAQLNVDGATEVGETQYAQSTRAVAAKDPAAGWTMWGLNPYREIGAQRARSRLAAQEIEYGMPGYINSRSGQINYSAPDQGFGALNKLRAEYVAQVTGRFGIDENSPGFQKYTAPAIEKASEREATRISEDRTKYYDELMPRQLTQLLKNQMSLYDSPNASFELQGNVYTRGKTPEPLYWSAAGLKLDTVARDYLQKSGPGGMGAKWARQAYEGLMAEAFASGDQKMMRLVGMIRSTEPLRGPDGKPAVGPDGQQVYLSWADLYGQDRLDAQIKYEQAGYSLRAAQSKDFGARAEAAIGGAIQGMTPGPERANAANAALNQFIQQETAAGRPPSAVAIQEARKGMKEAHDLTSDLVFQQDDPSVPTRYLAQLGQSYGSDFDAARERGRAEAIAASMANQKEAQQFLTQAYSRIEQKEKEVQDMSGYSAARDKVINDNINARLQRNYVTIGDASIGKADREESERRQRLAYTQHVNSRIKEKEASLHRRLTETEARGVTQQAIDEYGKNDKEALQYLFPGSQAYPHSPSVDPYGTIRPTQLGADGQPRPPQGGGASGPPPKVYTTNQLDDIPNRAVELRQYRTKAVMDLNSVRDVMFDAIDGKQQSAKFERAWRDAGAPSAWDFLQKQLQFYPNYKGGDWTPEEEKKARQRLVSMAGNSSGEVARVALVRNHPNLGAVAQQFASRGLNAVFGINPASASEMSYLRASGGGWQGGSGPFTGSAGGGSRTGLAAVVSSGEGGWNSVNYGTTGSASSMSLTSMTIAQVEQLQSRGRVFAVGAYQFTPGVLSRARRDAGLTGNERMTPDVQTKLFWGLAMGGKRPALAAYLKGHSNDLNAAHHELSMEWAGVQGPSGRGHYDGDSAGNHASVASSRVRQALIQARRQFSGR